MPAEDAVDGNRPEAFNMKLPVVLLVAYFMISWMESFPMVAFTSLMNDDLKMPLSTITYYYAVSYLPFMWKPLFGWISDTFPIWGRRRVPYIVLTSAGCCATLILTALFVHSVPMLFLTATIRDVFNAFLQLMIDAFVVDLARLDLPCTATLQGQANAAKWAGTLVSQIMALVVFVRTATASGSARLIIAATAVAPGLLGFLALSLPEELVPTSRDGSVRQTRTEGLRFAFVTAIAQVNFILIGCQSFLDTTIWWSAVAVVALASVALLLYMYAPKGRRCGIFDNFTSGTDVRFLDEEADGTSDGPPTSQAFEWKSWKWAGLCSFCLLINAIPTREVSMSQYRYKVFGAKGAQILGIVGSAASLVASLAFGKGFHRWSIRPMFAVATLVAMLIGLSALPFVYTAAGCSGTQDLLSMVGFWGMMSTALGGFTSMFSVLPVDTLVTSASGGLDPRWSSTAYAILLGLYSFGATVGGIISASAVQMLGLDGEHWEALPQWILIAALLRLVVFPLLLLIPRDAGRRAASTERPSESTRQHSGLSLPSATVAEVAEGARQAVPLAARREA